MNRILAKTVFNCFKVDAYTVWSVVNCVPTPAKLVIPV